jgi:hypothetical protein
VFRSPPRTHPRADVNKPCRARNVAVNFCRHNPARLSPIPFCGVQLALRSPHGRRNRTISVHLPVSSCASRAGAGRAESRFESVCSQVRVANLIWRSRNPKTMGTTTFCYRTTCLLVPVRFDSLATRKTSLPLRSRDTTTGPGRTATCVRSSNSRVGTKRPSDDNVIFQVASHTMLSVCHAS